MAKKPPRHSKKGKKPPNKFERQGHNLPEIGVLLITGTDSGGELIAEPLDWDKHKKPPHIVVTESGRSRAAAKGDRVLAKLRRVSPHLYQALVIRVLPGDAPQAVLGVFVATSEGGLIEPVSRKNKESYVVARGDTGGAQPGELVSGVTQPGVPSLAMSYAKVTERLGRLDSPKAASLIAASMHKLPSLFSGEALREAETATAPVMDKHREDLRHIPLVTIDGEDARDFDDAVFAERDGSGFHLVVAIADVAYYVAEGSALDAEAFERGNSVYFPDRVIPMLPERLSNGLCSLMPDEDRYCLAVHIWIDAQGEMKRYHFVRGLMRSKARLTYNQVETMSTLSLRERGGASRGEGPHPNLLPEGEGIVANLFAAYAALAHERDARGALDLNLPEYKIIFDAAGNVADIAPRARLESHRLIEAYMIAANVAAADYLLKNNAPGIYRVHEPPADERLEDLRTLLKMAGYSLQKGGIKSAHFNRILHQSEGKPEQAMIHTSVLRAQMQAFYSHENLGHFGLSLQKYGHFTSPIRRYADLVVHRSLVKLITRDEERGSNTTSSRPSSLAPRHLAETALHISQTERRAMMAERDASDRYKVSFMTRQIGNVFAGTINGLNEYGLFVTLLGNGITGFIPVRNLSGDFFRYDKQHASFTGSRTRVTYTMGQPVMIRVKEANAITGSLIFEPEARDQAPQPPLRPKHQHKNKQHERPRHKRRH